ncbi:MAG: glycosyltransferase family 2 protein [Bacteroidia bacterium]|nr:glycosyltransferase family 2 protein [Bacteroidia bacterium]MDW8014913.1 glycosyltransferase family 2 protein [Bacteroidia bacterium]
MVSEPVLLLVYNRLDTLQHVWEMLRRVKPRLLFISADGPKPNEPDQIRTQAVRTFVQSHIDWPCEAYFHFIPENLGCRRAVAQGLSWFFSQVERGIVLEDDTLPHPSFFEFMSEMLERYADDDRIGMVSGTQLFPNHPALAPGWDFIRIGVIWGWGSWRRVWAKYELEPSWWARLRAEGFPEHRLSSLGPYARYLWEMTQRVMEGKIDTWDYHLSLLLLREGHLNVIPTQNLVRNLGHGHPLAVNIRKKNWMSFLPLQRWQRGEGPLWVQPNLAYEQDIPVPWGFWTKVRLKLKYYEYAWGLRRSLPDDPIE